MNLVALLINVFALCIVFGVLYWAAQQLLPDPFKKYALVILVVVFVLMLLGVLLGGVQLPYMMIWRR